MGVQDSFDCGNFTVSRSSSSAIPGFCCHSHEQLGNHASGWPLLVVLLVLNYLPVTQVMYSMLTVASRGRCEGGAIAAGPYLYLF